MKGSLTRKITIPFFLVFLILTLLLAAIGSATIYEGVMSEFENLLLSNAKCLKSILEDESITTESEFMNEFYDSGSIIVEGYNVDYISLYVPDDDYDQVFYKGLIQNNDTDSKSRRTNTDSHNANEQEEQDPYDFIWTTDYKLDPAETKVWENRAKYDVIRCYTEVYDEICVIVKVQDPEGQEYLMTVERSYDSILAVSFAGVIGMGAFILILFIAMAFTLSVVIKSRVSKPAQKISEAMEQFVVNGKRSEIKLKGEHNDELGRISNSFNKMADDIDNYVADISKLTSEQEHHKTEIEIAGKIQQGFLPSNSGNFEALDISSLMIPARDIGGDMYDYRKLDDTHYYFLIADVVGKGLSASLYMSAMLTCIRQLVVNKPDPADVLKEANNYLAEKNPDNIFITAFIGIYDSETRVLTYANAGHNPPYRIGKEFTVLDGSEGIVLGLFKNEEYENASIDLEVADRLFLFTDGITEAQNPDGGFYSEERLESFLKGFRNGELIPAVMADLARFVQKQEQSDDITILSVLIKDNKIARSETRLALSGSTREFNKIREVIFEANMSEEEKMSLCLIAEEIYVNICSYAFPAYDRSARKVIFSFQASDKVVMTFRDNGIPYNPLENTMDEEDIKIYDPSEDEGGLGKFIAFNIADEVKYDSINGENVLTIMKTLKGEQE